MTETRARQATYRRRGNREDFMADLPERYGGSVYVRAKRRIGKTRHPDELSPFTLARKLRPARGGMVTPQPAAPAIHPRQQARHAPNEGMSGRPYGHWQAVRERSPRTPPATPSGSNGSPPASTDPPAQIPPAPSDLPGENNPATWRESAAASTVEACRT